MDEVGIQHHQHLTLILVVAQEILLTALLKEDGLAMELNPTKKQGHLIQHTKMYMLH